MNKPVEITSILEQFETMVSQTTPIIGAYYRELVKSGIPNELASVLTIEWHRMFWQTQFKSKKDD